MDYLTKIDKRLQTRWHDRTMPLEQLPDLYRSIRMAYAKAELPSQTDHYLFREGRSNRKFVLWPQLKEKFSLRKCFEWGKDFTWSVISGYGTKPFRVIIIGVIISVFYALFYAIFGPPHEALGPSSLLATLYFSFTTFATLGYGDITYSSARPWMRLVSTSEAMFGAVLIALFVVIIARKIIRR